MGSDQARSGERDGGVTRRERLAFDWGLVTQDGGLHENENGRGVGRIFLMPTSNAFSTGLDETPIGPRFGTIVPYRDGACPWTMRDTTRR